jgi:exopolyphosphatase/guanosine-5'-triphosphate,3'-diphosphate pyrophosphatase
MTEGKSAFELHDYCAGIDLGSNSFHMVIARVDEEKRLTFVDRQKEQVLLAAGLTDEGQLSDEAVDRAVQCLARFGERLRGIHPDQVRVVGTNTFRKCHNANDVMARCEEALGHSIEIISGREEARLIYQGVSLHFTGIERRIVVDIGGGSTELILGEGDEILALDSHYCGCVSWTMEFFPDRVCTASAFRKARLAARRQIGTNVRNFRDKATTALGSSGTINAIERALVVSGLSEDGITQDGLRAMETELIQGGQEFSRSVGISEGRAKVLPGGLAILQTAMRTLRIEKMTATKTALREGLLVDLLGRGLEQDVRIASVRRLVERFDVDLVQATRVSETALLVFGRVHEAMKLSKEPHRTLLRWAAMLHEVGLFMGFAGYHKHGAYLLANSELAGFSFQEQRTLAALVLCHRGRLDPKRIEGLRPGREIPVGLIVILRVARVLNRGRSANDSELLGIRASETELHLDLERDWLNERPLTLADLEEEQAKAGQVGFSLTWSTSEPE